MKPLKNKNSVLLISLPFVLCTLTSCLTAKKIDKFVAKEYNNELPKPSKKRSAVVEMKSTMPSGGTEISTTVHKMDKFLPLLFYWHVKESQNCSLNSAIAETNISNALSAAASKGLSQKLNGQKLELTLEQAPSAFSLIDDEHMVWFIYGFSWTKVYVHPDNKDLVVSYKLVKSDSAVKTGTVTVRNTDTNKNLRFFQSWKSAISEYIQTYNTNLALMTRSLVTKLNEEL
jgi:hypothetical protein